MNEKYKFDENLVAERSLREDFESKTFRVEQELQASRIEKEFSKLDKEGNGQVTKSDILNFFIAKGLSQQKSKQLFDDLYSA